MEPVGQIAGYRARLESAVLAPFRGTQAVLYVWVALLLAIIAWGAFAYSTQWRDGLYATGMRDRIFWGLYVTMFVYFIGASMAGTFVSAILRIARAEWRLSIIRGAEMMTVGALFTAALFIMMDIGRPERAPNIVLFGRWESPLVWDVYGLATYMTGSILYLYTAMVPDLALARDRLGSAVAPARRLLLELVAIGWRGHPGQLRILAGVLTVMTIIMIPVAVMMHTVTSWVFAMTLREPWDSSMFGIYFVGGAVYSGVGLIVILMVVMRRIYHLEEYITPAHFRYLGYMLAAFATIMVFFNVSEFVTLGYKTAHEGPFNLHQMTHGALAPIFWTYIWGGLGLPILLILFPPTRSIPGVFVASVAANIGMLLERYFIVVGGLRIPLNPYEPAHYAPTWVEWSLMAAGFALFALIVTALLKLFPGLAVTEMLEAYETHRPADEAEAAAALGAPA